MAYHTGQVTPLKSSADGSLLYGRQAKTAIVKHHRIDNKTSRLFTQKLDAVAVLVDKDEHITVAHVGRLGEQPVAHAVIKAEHDYRRLDIITPRCSLLKLPWILIAVPDSLRSSRVI